MTRRTPPVRTREIDAAFMQAYRTLRQRIEAFLALPLDDSAARSRRPQGGDGPDRRHG